MIVKLNPFEQRICEWLAKQRHSTARANNVKDKKIGPQSAEETDLDGVGAEFAVGKALNLYVDMSASPRSGGSDLISRNHVKIDVKQTKYANGHLVASLSKEVDDVDIYILVTGQMPEYNIIGWCVSERLINDDCISDLGHGPGYCLSQDKLKPIPDTLVYPELINEIRGHERRR